ncbi:hypothetical protein M3Y96_01163600 [Aphelenchoides besseyi]|nr:hypothetical protein M3Y96_01163600 [Aphelenchoides besseyi]
MNLLRTLFRIFFILHVLFEHVNSICSQTYISDLKSRQLKFIPTDESRCKFNSNGITKAGCQGTVICSIGYFPSSKLTADLQCDKRGTWKLNPNDFACVDGCRGLSLSNQQELGNATITSTTNELKIVDGEVSYWPKGTVIETKCKEVKRDAETDKHRCLGDEWLNVQEQKDQGSRPGLCKRVCRITSSTTFLISPRDCDLITMGKKKYLIDGSIYTVKLPNGKTANKIECLKSEQEPIETTKGTPEIPTAPTQDTAIPSTRATTQQPTTKTSTETASLTTSSPSTILVTERTTEIDKGIRFQQTKSSVRPHYTSAFVLPVILQPIYLFQPHVICQKETTAQAQNVIVQQSSYPNLVHPVPFNVQTLQPKVQQQTPIVVGQPSYVQANPFLVNGPFIPSIPVTNYILPTQQIQQQPIQVLYPPIQSAPITLLQQILLPFGCAQQAKTSVEKSAAALPSPQNIVSGQATTISSTSVTQTSSVEILTSRTIETPQSEQYCPLNLPISSVIVVGDSETCDTTVVSSLNAINFSDLNSRKDQVVNLNANCKVTVSCAKGFRSLTRDQPLVLQCNNLTGHLADDQGVGLSSISCSKTCDIPIAEKGQEIALVEEAAITQLNISCSPGYFPDQQPYQKVGFQLLTCGRNGQWIDQFGKAANVADCINGCIARPTLTPDKDEEYTMKKRIYLIHGITSVCEKQAYSQDLKVRYDGEDRAYYCKNGEQPKPNGNSNSTNVPCTNACRSLINDPDFNSVGVKQAAQKHKIHFDKIEYVLDGHVFEFRCKNEDEFFPPDYNLQRFRVKCDGKSRTYRNVATNSTLINGPRRCGKPKKERF